MKNYLVFMLIFLLAACASPNQLNSGYQVKVENEAAVPAQPIAVKNSLPLPTGKPSVVEAANPTKTPVPTATLPARSQSGQPASSQPQAVGPDAFPEGYNPLTGQPVEDAALLSLPPALVSISNFPVTARPQAGLSFAPYVFEMYIGEGMTRFLALFYGDYPQANSGTGEDALTQFDEKGIGPVRSGRLPYESLRQLYNGFVVMASAYRAVGAQLGSTTNVYGSDENDINSAMIDVSKLKGIAQANAASQKEAVLTGNLFSELAPAGGEEVSRLWVFYNFLNQINWQYDAASGAYLRSQDNADGSGKFMPSTDRLTGEQLAFENVIVLFAKHRTFNSEKTLIDMDLMYTGGKAILFRDGKAYPIYWNTLNGDYEKTSGRLRPIRFTDREGKPIALKPGQTWVEMVDLTATVQKQGAGTWKVRFYAP